MTLTMCEMARHRRVVVPHDTSDMADLALREAASLLAPDGHLFVVHVLERIDPLTPIVVWPTVEDEPRRRWAHAVLSERLPIGASRHVLIGDPARQILDFLSQVDADLVVMPSHGRTGLAHFALGSVAEKVLRLASCPTLVVKKAPHTPDDRPRAGSTRRTS